MCKVTLTKWASLPEVVVFQSRLDYPATLLLSHSVLDSWREISDKRTRDGEESKKKCVQEEIRETISVKYWKERVKEKKERKISSRITNWE